MNSKEHCLFICDSLERYSLYERLAKALSIEAIFVTTEPLVKLKCYISGYKCYLIRRLECAESSRLREVKLEDSIDYINGKIPECDILPLMNSILTTLDIVNKKYNVVTMIIWNGQQLFGRVANQYAIEHSYKRLFLEISNLPNKIFADPVGVNALSSLMGGHELTPFNDEPKHIEWVEEYIKSKERPIPQSQTKTVAKVFKAINLLLKKAFSGFNVKVSNYNKPLNFDKLNSVITKNHIRGNYVFLPLQVTSDTQIKLHSDYSNIDALMFALEYAKNNELHLIVKLHPAETSQNFVDKLVELKNENDFILSDNNTVELIKNSRAVITINSTVGLEAKIFGKEVIVLGRAFYSAFDDDDLKSYIHNYLVDGIDYFSNQPIPKVKVDELLAKAR